MFSRFERMVAYRYLRSPRQEGFISVIAGFSFIGISLGVATLIIVMSVMNGFREELLGRIIGMNGHISIITPSPSGIPGYTPLTEKLKTIPGVVGVLPEVERESVAMFRSQARGVSVHGVRPEDLAQQKLIADNIRVGDLNEFGRGEDNANTIFIGRRLAERLGVKMGESMTIVSPEGNTTAFGTLPRQKAFRVIGVFEAGVAQYDDRVIFMPLTAAQTFYKMPEAVNSILIYADHPDNADLISAIIRPMIDESLVIHDWHNTNNALFNAVQVERSVMFVILTLIILIAAFNIISSLIMLVKDKTRDIAIMRTMGATHTSMMRVFFLTGSSIGVVGTLLGVGLGLAFALNIETIRQWLQGLLGFELFNAEIYFLTQLPCKINWMDVIWSVALSLGLSFLATLYPSWRAARLDPVEALRW